MNYDEARCYLLEMPEAVADFPFYPDILVPKVKGKMFATLSQRNGIDEMNLKCDPDEALALRDIFSAVRPGYHMNKKHWNTVTLDGSIPSGEIRRMIENSYLLVVMKLPKLHRVSLLGKLV
jgi:predicted DNA-binding protein (MmcQ/YjbR family)